MKNKNAFIAGHILFLSTEALKYSKMDESKVFCETLHDFDPQTGQYSMRVVHKTAMQKYNELKHEIIDKLNGLSSEDFSEVKEKIEELTTVDSANDSVKNDILSAKVIAYEAIVERDDFSLV